MAHAAHVLPLALAILSAGVAHADPDPDPDDRRLPRVVRLDYLPDPAVRRSCDRAEALELGIANEAKRDPIDPNAAARLIVRITHKGGRYVATVEIRDEEGVSVYADSFGPVRTCDMLLIDIQVGVGYAFRRADQAVAEKAAADKAADKAAADKAAADKAAADKAAADKVATAARPAPPRPWALRAAASGGFGLGLSPADVAGVFSLEGGVEWRFKPHWVISGSLGMLWSPRRSALMPAEMSPDREVGTTVFTGVVAPCVHRQIVHPWIFVCPGFEIGQLNGKITMGGRSLAGNTWRVAFEPRLGVEVPLPTVPRFPQFAVNAYGNAVVPLVPAPVITLEGPSMSSGKRTEVWRTPIVGGAFYLGLLARFPL